MLMIADKPFRAIKPGQTFTATDQEAVQLHRARLAHRADEPCPFTRKPDFRSPPIDLPAWDPAVGSDRIIMYFHQHRLEPFAAMLASAGYRVEVADQHNLLDFFTAPRATHLIWGMPPKIVEGHEELFVQLRTLPNFWWAEQGWLPQRGNFYIDPTGPNALSAIRGAARNMKLTEDYCKELAARLAAFHDGLVATDEGFIFCPLQVETDSNVRLWSRITDVGTRMLWFVRQVCEAFPDVPIVFRTHPQERGTMDRQLLQQLSGFPNARLDNGGSSVEWCARARAIVSINSTVLIEALTFGKPCASFGDGIVSDNGVTLECKGDVGKLHDVLDYQPDQEAIARFLHLLYQRQIPIAVQSADCDRYPMLRDMLRQIRLGPAATAIVDPVRPQTRPPVVAGNVYGFLEYMDLRTSALPMDKMEPLAQPNVKGLLLNDFVLSEFHEPIRTWCAEHDRECIPMFTEDFRWPHERRIDYAKTFGGQIAIGNTDLHEWSGGAEQAKQHIGFAAKYDFRWVCALTHFSLCRDFRSGLTLRRVLQENDILTFCLCGNVLLGYLFDEPRMPGMNDTTLTGANLNRQFGLTIDRLREYCSGLRIYSGAGGQRGLALGSRQYAAECGFKGVLCWTPFDLRGTLDVATKPRPARYPQAVRGEAIGIGDDFRRE